MAINPNVFFGNSGGNGKKPRLAVVQSVPAAGLITVKFEGDATTSAEGFAYLSSSYPSPAVSDRVLMAPVGNSYVAIGKLSTSP